MNAGNSTEWAHPNATKLERLFVWAAGYSARNLAGESAQDREPIGKLGGTVLFAALVAMTNWGIAGYVFADGLDQNLRMATAAVAGLIALGAVLSVDRSAMFFFDTMAPARGVVFLWVAFRGAVILAISSVTAQAVMPVLLNNELAANALHMQEASESRRISDLTKRFELPEKRSAVAAAVADLARVKQDVDRLPTAIQRKLEQAKRCWSAYASRKSNLLNAGIPELDARTTLRLDANRCFADQAVAQKEKDAHDAKMRAMLREAEYRQSDAETAVRFANAAMSARIERAGAIEREAINAKSARVLVDLLATDSGAMGKWALVTFVLICLELMPLFSKLLAGKSAIGIRRGTSRAMETVLQRERLESSKHDAAVASAVGQVMQQSILEACHNPETRQFCVQLFGTKLRAFVPFEIVTTLLRDIETKQEDIDQALRRYPKYAGAISQAWSEALHDTVELLRNDTAVGAVQPAAPKPTRNAGATNPQHEARAA